MAAVLVCCAVLLTASQWSAIHTEGINWDEFALLARAEETIRTGKLVGGGRPGLAVLILVPFVKDCVNSVQAVTNARQLWLAFTALYLAGVFFLVVQGHASEDRRCAWRGAAIAVALMALVPAFLRWSLHVRTDQPALMFATWGGVLLLASYRRVPLAAAAGALLALGYLCSQKAAYVGALVGVLLAVRIVWGLQLRRGEWQSWIWVLASATAGFLAVVLSYPVILSFFYEPTPTITLDATLGIFTYYSEVFGYRAYVAMLPSLGAHVLLLGLLVCAAAVSWRRAPQHRQTWIASATVLLLGVLVGWLHGGAFPYFWMTLGLFPAVAIGLGWTAMLEVFNGPLGRALMVTAAPLLMAFAIPFALTLHHDTQQVQRNSFEFVERNFDDSARGFQAEGALFCRHDPSPFRTYFADAILRLLWGPENRSRAEAFVNEFRTRPVTFMIAHRLSQFPELVDHFWNTHYVLYRDEVLIPGRHVRGGRGDSFSFEVTAPGSYRWRSQSRERLAFADRVVESGAVFNLDRGTYKFTLLDDVSSGILAIAVKDDPRSEGPPFYHPQPLREIDPLYPRF